VHARSALRRFVPEGHRRLHARFRQGDDRRGLPSDDDVFPARRPRRDVDRADGIREPGIARRLHRHAAPPGRRSEEAGLGSLLPRRPAPHPPPPPRRDARGARPGAALEAAGGEAGGGVGDFIGVICVWSVFRFELAVKASLWLGQ
jgi:hypothetical protein